MPMQEDLWLYTCLRILGVSMVLQRDLLLEEGYDDDEVDWFQSCASTKYSTTVAFHPAKSVKSWNKCLTRSMHKTLSVLDKEAAEKGDIGVERGEPKKEIGTSARGRRNLRARKRPDDGSVGVIAGERTRTASGGGDGRKLRA